MKAISLGFCVFLTFYLGQCMVIYQQKCLFHYIVYHFFRVSIKQEVKSDDKLFNIYIYFGKALTCTCVRIEPQENKHSFCNNNESETKLASQISKRRLEE